MRRLSNYIVGALFPCILMVTTASAQNEGLQLIQALSEKPALESTEMFYNYYKIAPTPKLTGEALQAMKKHIVDDSITDPQVREETFTRLYENSGSFTWRTHLFASPEGTKFTFFRDILDPETAYITYVVPSRAEANYPSEAYRYDYPGKAAFIEPSFLKAPIEFDRYYQLPRKNRYIFLAMVLNEEAEIDLEKLATVFDPNKRMEGFGDFRFIIEKGIPVDGLETTKFRVDVFGTGDDVEFEFTVLSEQMDALVEFKFEDKNEQTSIVNSVFKYYDEIGKYLPQNHTETIVNAAGEETITSIDILSIVANPILDRSLFTFDPPKGFMIVDGRHSPAIVIPSMERENEEILEILKSTAATALERTEVIPASPAEVVAVLTPEEVNETISTEDSSFDKKTVLIFVAISLALIYIMISVKQRKMQ